MMKRSISFKPTVSRTGDTPFERIEDVISNAELVGISEG